MIPFTLRVLIKLTALFALITAPLQAQHDEHEAILELAPVADATFVATQSGAWFNNSTWEGNTIPTAGARVHIPEGIRVTYQGTSGRRLKTVRVDGDLFFAYWRDTRMVVDTLLISHEGRLTIGDNSNPIRAAFTARIEFADNGDIDPNWDSELLSRGIISAGQVDIHGAKKDTFHKVTTAPMSGDQSLTLNEIPQNWQAGDRIVITGTRKRGYDIDERHTPRDSNWSGTEDEVVTITSVSGARVEFEPALQFDHDTPAPDLRAYVANMSRNIIFTNEGGNNLPIHQRGHLMLMNSATDIRYAEFTGLGRTDKSRTSRRISLIADVSSTSNVQGRYPIHLHRTGITSCGRALGACDCLQTPIYIVGNAVNGSPGWGIVQHSANANFVDNAVYDAFGACFVAEGSDDVGHWLRNIAIRSRGHRWGIVSAQTNSNARDAGRNGDGFYFNGRLVEVSENVAANTTGGYTFVSRNGAQADGSDNPINTKSLDQPEIARGGSTIQQINPNLSEFRDNESFGNQTGFQVIRNNSAQNHDLRSILRNFTAWEVYRGFVGRYSPHYTIINARLIGTNTRHTRNNGSSTAILFERKAFDWTINGASIENFGIGVDARGHDEGRQSDTRVGIHFIDMKFRNVSTEYINITEEGHFFHESKDLILNRLAVSYSPLAPLQFRGSRRLDWLKVDSIGPIDRVWEFDTATLIWNHSTFRLLSNEGYYRDSDGDPFILVEDLAADRATGLMEKFLVPLYLNFTSTELRRFTDNGVLSFEGPLPEANSDRFRVQPDTPTQLDVIANDLDPDGGIVWVDGSVQPTFGDIYPNEDGSFLYIPDLGYTGNDFFSYWLRDEEGNISRGEVAVRVGQGAIPEPRIIQWVAPGEFESILEENIQPLAIQNRLVIPTGESSVQTNPVSNDHDINGDELFLTSIHRGRGLAAVDIRVDHDGLVTATNSDLSSSGRTDYFYQISDGTVENGNDDGIFPIFIGRNNSTRAPGQESFGPDLLSRAAAFIPYSIEGANGPLEHLHTYTAEDFSRIEVTSDQYDIGSVLFYLDGALVRTENLAPFTHQAPDIRPGQYVLRIVATSESDNEGHFLFDDRKIITIIEPTAPLTPIEDSYVRDGSFSNDNFGDDEALVAKLDPVARFNRRFYLKFNVSRLADVPFTSATLRLRLKTVGSATSSNRHTVHIVDNDSWQEPNITWRNQPNIDTAIGSAPIPQAGGWLELDVTSAVESQANGDGILSLVVTSNTTDFVSYFSREASADLRPEIVFETAPILGSTFEEWANINGLSGQEANPLATPNEDKVANLLKYAFNISDAFSAATTLSTNNDITGLPRIYLSDDSNRKLMIEYIRNKSNPNLTYLAQFSSSLESGTWRGEGTEVSVVSVNDDWERVTVADRVSTSSNSRRFGRVRVELNSTPQR